MRFTLLLIFVSIFGFSQQKIIKHQIKNGETITSIAEKYHVKINDIYNLNPNSKGLLKLNSTLKISIKNKEIYSKKVKNRVTADTIATISTKRTFIKIKDPKDDFGELVHEVKRKETLYGISKLHHVSIQSIKDANPNLEYEDLKIGVKIIIPELNKNKAEILKIVEVDSNILIRSESIFRIVLPKETKFGIAKQYGITVQELEKQNPSIIKNLPVGYKLKIIGTVAINSVTIPIDSLKTTDKTIIIEDNKNPLETYILAKPITNTALAEQLVTNALENIGVRYRSGGTTPKGFDCSGFMIYTFGNLDIDLPRTSSQQSQFGIKIKPYEAQKGDLIFFSTNGTGGVNHVGMIVEVLDDEIKFVHSSTSNGVMISSNKESYYAKRFVCINRVLE